MSKGSETTDDSVERHPRQMPDFHLNRDPNARSDAVETTESEGASRRGFMAASAALGLGAAGMAGSASADDGDYDDEDNR